MRTTFQVRDTSNTANHTSKPPESVPYTLQTFPDLAIALHGTTCGLPPLPWTACVPEVGKQARLMFSVRCSRNDDLDAPLLIRIMLTYRFRRVSKAANAYSETSVASVTYCLICGPLFDPVVGLSHSRFPVGHLYNKKNTCKMHWLPCQPGLRYDF